MTTNSDERLLEISKLMKRGKHEEAYRKAKVLYEKYSNDPEVALRYAVCLGDRTGEERSKKSKANHLAASKILRQLVYRIRAFDPSRRSIVLNEYYWFSKQPLKQYHLGLKDVGLGDRSGFYSMGVGGWCIAKKYIEAGDLVKARFWAKRSSDAWREYFKYKKNYYNAWVWYARSEGFLNGKEAMLEALKKAQRLNGQRNDFVEFLEVKNEFKVFQKKNV